MKKQGNNLIEAVKELKQYKEGLRISNRIRKNLELIGRKGKDTLRNWYLLGCIIEAIKKIIGNSYGSSLVAVLAREYGHDEADLHRAAKFARCAPDYEAFQKKNPDVSDLRQAVRFSSEQRKGSKEKRKVSNSPSVKVVARRLDHVDETVEKLIQAYFVLKAKEEDTTEIVARLKRIRDKVDAAFGPAASSNDGVAPSTSDDSLAVAPYEECTSVEKDVAGDLEGVPLEDVVAVVEEIVRVEGPIHVEDLTERVRAIAKRKKVTRALSERILSAAKTAEWENETLTRRGNFFWPKSEKWRLRIRRRGHRKHRILDHICDEELRLAAEHVRIESGDSDAKTIARKTLNTLGFEKPRASGCDRVMALLREDLGNQSTLSG